MKQRTEESADSSALPGDPATGAWEGEPYYQRILEQSYDAVAVTGPEGTITYASPQWTEILGYSRDELYGTSAFSIIHPDDVERSGAALQQIVDQPSEIVTTVTRFVHKDGSIRWIEARDRNLIDDPVVAGILTVARDVTDEIAAREAAQENQQRLDSALRAGKMCTWDWDVATGRIDWSGQAHSVLGVLADQLPTTIEDYFQLIHPRDREVERDATLGEFLTESREEGFDFWHRLQTPAGEERMVDGHALVLCDDAGHPAHMVGTLADTTVRRRALEDQLAWESKAQQSEKLESLGLLAGGVAHDFNNLLAGIMGNAELALMETHEGSQAQSNLDDIVALSERAADLCRQLLAYAGKARFQIQAVDLSHLLGETAKLLDATVLKQCHVQYELGEGLPAIEADVAQIHQVALNLVTNAADAVGGAGGTIRIATGLLGPSDPEIPAELAHQNDGTAPYVFFEVSDDGCGMNADTRAHLFEPFFSTKETGTGLGLSAVKGIIDGHKGALSVNSAPDIDTTMRVILPATDRMAEMLESPKAPSPDSEGTGHVLVVDDEPSVRKNARLALERAGYKVVTAAGGIEGIDRFREHQGELVAVLLDLTMPGMSGLEVVARLRAIDSGIPIVLSSGYVDGEPALPVVEDEIDAFIHKPYLPSAMVELLHTVISARA